jgi:YebC/PmpR family DNA-binding regulatory protein
MAGHSKWATTKRHKAAVDAKRGKLFSMLSKDITLAARSGGGDENFNPRLRMIVLKAKDANMPADNIDRAVKKGTGELAGDLIEELTYEGYGPSGVGIIVEVTTDNKNRSASEVRSAFNKAGGNLAGAGALAFNFQRRGQFLISAEKTTEDRLIEIALDAGAEDVISDEEGFEVLCAIADFERLSQALTDAKIEPDASEIAYIANTPIVIEDIDTAKQLLKLIDTLENLDDVKSVWSNLEIADGLNVE